jgi:hypothetical protein
MDHNVKDIISPLPAGMKHTGYCGLEISMFKLTNNPNSFKHLGFEI